MPTFVDPVADTAEAYKGLRGLAHANRAFEDLAVTTTQVRYIGLVRDSSGWTRARASGWSVLLPHKARLPRGPHDPP